MNTLSLKNRHALVTGSSQGIGAGIADGLQQSGAVVVRHGLQAAEGLYVQHDLLDPSKRPEQLIERAFELAPALDTLVLNAGSFFDVPFLEMTDVEWDKTVSLNLRATFFLAQAFARRRVELGGGGCLLLISSTNGFQAEADSVAYDTSKGGLVMMTRSLAVSLAPHGIRVNGIAPGLIRTPLTQGWMQPRAHDLLQHYEKKILLKKVGSPADCAGAAVFLCSEAASYITGEIITIDGGLTCSQIGSL